MWIFRKSVLYPLIIFIIILALSFCNLPWLKHFLLPSYIFLTILIALTINMIHSVQLFKFVAEDYKYFKEFFNSIKNIVPGCFFSLIITNILYIFYQFLPEIFIFDIYRVNFLPFIFLIYFIIFVRLNTVLIGVYNEKVKIINLVFLGKDEYDEDKFDEYEDDEYEEENDDNEDTGDEDEGVRYSADMESLTIYIDDEDDDDDDDDKKDDDSKNNNNKDTKKHKLKNTKNRKK